MREHRPTSTVERRTAAADAAADVEAGVVASLTADCAGGPPSDAPEARDAAAARERLVTRLATLQAAASDYAAMQHAAGVSRGRVLARVHTLVRRAMRAAGYDDARVATALETHVRRWCYAAMADRQHLGDRRLWNGILS